MRDKSATKSGIFATNQRHRYGVKKKVCTLFDFAAILSRNSTAL